MSPLQDFFSWRPTRHYASSWRFTLPFPFTFGNEEEESSRNIKKHLIWKKLSWDPLDDHYYSLFICNLHLFYLHDGPWPNGACGRSLSSLFCLSMKGKGRRSHSPVTLKTSLLGFTFSCRPSPPWRHEGKGVCGPEFSHLLLRANMSLWRLICTVLHHFYLKYRFVFMTTLDSSCLFLMFQVTVGSPFLCCRLER